MRRVLDVLPKVGSQEMSLASSPVLPVDLRERFSDPSPRSTSSHLPPQYEPFPPQHPSAYPPASQYIPLSGPPPPAFPIPQVQMTNATTSRLDPPPVPPRVSDTHLGPPPVPPRTYTAHLDPPPPRVQRGITMPIAGLPHDTHVAPGPYPSYASQAPSMSQSRSHSSVSGATQLEISTDRQRYRACIPHYPMMINSTNGGVNGVEDYEGDHDIFATHGDGLLAKGPPNHPAAGIQKNKKQGESCNSSKIISTH